MSEIHHAKNFPSWDESQKKTKSPSKKDDPSSTHKIVGDFTSAMVDEMRLYNIANRCHHSIRYSITVTFNLISRYNRQMIIHHLLALMNST